MTRFSKEKPIPILSKLFSKNRNKVQNKPNHRHLNFSEMKLKPFPESFAVHRWKEKGFSIGIQLSKTAWSFVGWWFELRWEIGQNRGQIKKNLLAFIAKGILCASHLFKLQEHSMSKNVYYCLLESQNPTQSFF